MKKNIRYVLVREGISSILSAPRRIFTNVARNRRDFFTSMLLAGSIVFANPGFALALENNATYEDGNPELVQLQNAEGDNVDSYSDVEVPEIFVDNSNDSAGYVDESYSYENTNSEAVVEVSQEEAVSENNSEAVVEVSQEEAVSENNSEAVVEVSQEEAVSENNSETVVEVSQEETVSENTSKTMDVVYEDANSSVAKTPEINISNTSSVEKSGVQSSSTVSTEIKEEGDYITETQTVETVTSTETSWAFYVFEKDGIRYVITDVKDDADSQKALAEVINERYGNSGMPTSVYSIDQLNEGYNPLSYGGSDLVVYVDKNRNVTVVNKDATAFEKLDENLNPVEEETKTEENKTNDQKTEDTTSKDSSKEDASTTQTETSKETSTETTNEYNIASDSYVVAVDEKTGQYYIYIGGTGLDHNQREALLHDLYRDYPEIVANGTPIIENGVLHFDATGKKIVAKKKSEDLAKNDHDSKDPNAEPGKKPHDDPTPTPTVPTPTPTVTVPTPTPTVPTPTPTVTVPTRTLPTTSVPTNNIPKTGDAGSLFGAVSTLLGGTAIAGFGASLRGKKLALSRATVCSVGSFDSYGYVEPGSAYEEQLVNMLVKKRGKFN